MPASTQDQVPPPQVPEDTTPQPGAVDYVYVNEKLDVKLSKILCEHWDVVESAYISGTKFVFRKIRREREQVIRYFFSIKSNFLDYLARPDTKQIELEAFIKVKKITSNVSFGI
jgi:hypothetical protein